MLTVGVALKAAPGLQQFAQTASTQTASTQTAMSGAKSAKLTHANYYE
jgi:hypothetical protein